MVEDKMTIREALPKDAQAINALSGELGYPGSEVALHERLSAILNHPEHKIWVAEAKGEMLGWIHASLNLRLESPFFVEITGLVVGETHRQKGIGRLLVMEVERWAKTHGHLKLRVRTNIIREEAPAFYKALGFKSVKQQMVLDKKN